MITMVKPLCSNPNKLLQELAIIGGAKSGLVCEMQAAAHLMASCLHHPLTSSCGWVFLAYAPSEPSGRWFQPVKAMLVHLSEQ